MLAPLKGLGFFFHKLYQLLYTVHIIAVSCENKIYRIELNRKNTMMLAVRKSIEIINAL